jgi:lysozyme family protein
MFEKIYPIVLGFEGGYVNDPNDSGGATNKGITQNTYNLWRKSHNLPEQSVKFIADSEVSAIYKGIWKSCGSDLISVHKPLSGDYNFDTAVNCGDSQAIKFIQRACGAKDDGILGPVTLRALDNYNDNEILDSIHRQRLLFYANLAISQEHDRPSLKNWIWRATKLYSHLIRGN